MRATDRTGAAEDAMDQAVETLLKAKTIAVVGLDDREERAAYRVARYLQEHGHRIIPVPVQKWTEQTLGERAYRSLRDIGEPVDVVDVFVRGEQTDPFIDDAIAIGAKVVWLQEGIRNEGGVERARAAGLMAVQDRCAMVEHRRRLGEEQSPK